MKYRHPVLAAALAVLPLSGSLAAAKFPASMAGIWRIEKPVVAVRTADGEEPPLLPEAAKLYQRHLAQRQQGDTSYDSTTWCASAGMPRMMLLNSRFDLVVSPPYVAFLQEWNWWARTVYLDGALSSKPSAAPLVPPNAGPPPGAGGPPGGPAGAPPGGAAGAPAEARANFNEATGPMGLSRGRLEGDTMIIETTALRDTTLIDNSGLPHSDALKVIEHLRLKSADVLEDRIRIEDPKTFTQPWETLVTYRRQQGEIKEDVCLDRIKTGQPALPN